MRVENLLPQVYYKESRDFAYIGRLVELCINYMITAANTVSVYPDVNMDSYILQLLADTLGFKAKHNYDSKDLVYVCSSLSELFRYKGSKESIIKAVQLLINSQHVRQKIVWGNNLIWDSSNQHLTLTLPESLSDTILIEDLFDYILPSGVTYSIIKVSSEEYNAKDNVVLLNNDNDFSRVLLNDNQAGGLFEIQEVNDQTGAAAYLGNVGSSVVVDSQVNDET